MSPASGNGEAVFRQDDIRTQHARHLPGDGFGSRQLDQFGRLAPVEQLRDPCGTFAGDAQAVEQIHSRRQRKRLGRNPPFLAGEQPARRHGRADAFRAGEAFGFRDRGAHTKPFSANRTNSSVPASLFFSAASRTDLAASTCL
jgi:hypothetical protein